jgi:hypothetical protein
LYTPVVIDSPESEMPLSVLGEPLAQSRAQGAIIEDTGFYSISSHGHNKNSVNDSKFSHNSQSMERVLQEHAK